MRPMIYGQAKAILETTPGAAIGYEFVAEALEGNSLRITR